MGDATTLDALGASAARASFDEGKVVGVGGESVGDGTVMLYRFGAEGPEPTGQELPAVEFEGTLLFGGPRYLLSVAAAEELGFDIQPSRVM
ncbi:MAG: hypothetical protein M3535_06220, partial [Actinomycetota bacterium]|nr:hypothetical protein [Actinomycetota bacterium]